MLNRYYQITDTLHENLLTVVYRAIRLSDKQSVIIKMLKLGEMSEHRIAQFMNEQHVLAQLRSPKISRLLDVIATPSEYAHIFEDIGGSSLYDLLLRERFSLDESLKIALDIAVAMELIHQKHIIHADINPKNLIYNPKTKELQLIDFGYSIIDDHFRYNSDLNTGTSGNLMYMSPEQTGRTKQKIDHRSDFYSFGMTLYHLFAHRPPFEAQDRFELIHKQIALYPPELDTLIEHFPSPLSSIVKKLIAKKPQSRYQHDEALIHDLKQSLRFLDSSGEISDFEIASKDNLTLHIGDTLFGRETEIAILKEIVEKINAHEAVRLIVSGQSGVGKTRLMEEFFSYVKTSGVHIVRGKFEQYHVSHPFSTLKQLIIQIKPMIVRRVKENPLRLNDQSVHALGYTFSELREVLPKFTQQYSIEDVNQHLPFAINELLNYISGDSSPFIIFLDDIQWADSASIELITKTMQHMKRSNIHLILSYRDNEIMSNQKAEGLLRTVEMQISSRVYFFDLKPLKYEEIEALLKSIFTSNHPDVEALSVILHKKTLGNPFYLKTFLDNLVDLGAIFYENENWTCHLDHIQTLSISVDIAQLIAQRLEHLNEEQQRCLQMLSLLGNRFDIGLTYQLMERLHLNETILLQLESKGFIEIYGDAYQFIHDLIQYNALEQIKQEEKYELHRTIGNFLEQAYHKRSYDDIIGVVFHLNSAFEFGYRHKKIEILNLTALSEMVRIHSFAMALKLLRWIENHQLHLYYLRLKRRDSFGYSVLKVKILYLNRLHEEAHNHIQRLIDDTQTINEKLVCFGLYKDLYVTKGEGFEPLVEYGNAILDELGLIIPTTSDAIAREVERLNLIINRHPLSQKIETILELNEMKSLSNERIVALLVEYWEAAYYLADIPLMQWSYLNIIDYSYRYGNTSGSSFGYVLYGAQMISQGRYNDGYLFGDVSLKLTTMFGDMKMVPKVHNFMANFISPYLKGFQKNLPLYEKSLHQSKINGDIVFGTWANFLIYLSDYFGGKSLDRLHKNMIDESRWLLNSGDQKMIALFHLLKSTVSEWQDKSIKRTIDEAEAIKLWEEEKFYPGLAWYGIIKAQTCWMAGESEQGLEYLSKYVHTDTNEVIMFPKLRLHPLRALLLLGKTSPRSIEEEEQLQDDLQWCELFSKAAPKLFRFWKLLLKAKHASLRSAHWDVAKMYDNAINEARQMENPFAIAAASLCAGRFWRAKGFDDVSRFYLSEASVGLNQWGAYAAAVSFKNNVHTSSEVIQTLLDASSSSSSLFKSEPTNFRALLKAFYALSQTMGKNELLETLMNTILENATASKAVLILKEGEVFYTVAYSHFQTRRIELEHIRLSETVTLPQSIVLHAIETQHKIAINDPAHNGRFQYDEYYKFHQPSTSIVIPSSVEGIVLGVLYLENEEVSTPLSPDTIQTLRLLLTQASIVYKNALLYETLKKSDALLKKAQQISHVGSWQYDIAEDKIEWSEETYRIYELEPYSIDVNNQWVMDHIHSDDLELIMESKEKIYGGQPYCDVINRIITAKGNIRTVHQRAEVYWENDHQKLSGTIQDITETRQSEETIRMLSQVVSQTPFAVVITDSNGVIEYANNQTLKLTGYFQSELVGYNMSVLKSGIYTKHFYEELWDTIKTKRESWRGILVNKMKNGDIRDFASTIFPILDTKGVITHYASIQDDVTERNLKDKLFLMQTRQAQMGEMLSMIAHQWRQPLTIMSTQMNRQKVNIMLDKASYDDILHGYDEIETQIQYLSRTITDFKDFFKPDKQRVLSKSSLIVKKALDLIEHSLMNKGIRIEHCIGVDKEFQTYENELIQVVLNLIKNAQDAFDEEKIANPHIIIMSDQDDQNVILSIQDNAGGIKPEIMKSLFSPYSSTKKENGTGLGLYMSQIILQEHCHGSITAENIASGACFTLRFPKV